MNQIAKLGCVVVIAAMSVSLVRGDAPVGESEATVIDLTTGTQMVALTEHVYHSIDCGIESESDTVAAIMVKSDETLNEASDSVTINWIPTNNNIDTLAHRELPEEDPEPCWGESAPTVIDLPSGVRMAALTEHIRYSTEWGRDGESGAMVIVTLNGETLVETSGNGTVDWTPTSNGTYTLTHQVMSCGEQIGATLTATFIVDRQRPDNPVISPENGMTFGGSLSVSITCPTEGASIHFTTNGVDPTVESPVYRRFKIFGKTTVKAVAERDGLLSEVVVAEYALGQCTDPVISLPDGTVFEHSNQEIAIAWAETEGTLRYTLDGSDPTAESPVYGGPFTISESTVVKAKVFSDTFFDSSIVTASLTRVWVSVATPVIDAVASFTGSKTKVVISCATDGALIRYTLNGNEPNSHSTKYTGPFYVTQSCTVKVYAVKSDYLNSGVATFSIEKVWGIGDAMGDPDQTFTTAGDLPFYRVTDETAPNGEAMRSGQITHNQISTLTTTVDGPGTVTFSWRSSCEADPEGIYEWDHAAFSVDGVTVLKLDGENAWHEETVEITGAGSHTLVWSYIKDDVESEGEDAVWVAGWTWAPTGFAEGNVVGTGGAVVLTSAQAAWLNGLGEYAAVKAAVDGMDTEAFDAAYLLNLNVLSADRGYAFTVTRCVTDGGNIVLTVRLTRTGAVKGEDGTDGPINGTLKLSGSGTLEREGFTLVDATVSDPTFAEGDTATITVPKEGARRFFRPVITAR